MISNWYKKLMRIATHLIFFSSESWKSILFNKIARFTFQ